MYTLDNKQEIRTVLNLSIANAIDTMYPTLDLNSHFTKEILSAKLARIKLLGSNPVLSGLNVYMSESDFKKSINDFSDIDRKAAWKYRSYEVRETLLANILGNQKKLSYILRETLIVILRNILSSDSNSISLGQAVHATAIKADTYTRKDGSVHPITDWGVDEMRLQLVNELCELDLLDLKLSHKTHMVSIPSKLTDMVTRDEWRTMITATKLLSLKTILTKPATIESKNMISQSSWWYKTPKLSEDQLEFIDTMNNLKWEFIDNAEDLIEEAYRKHLNEARLPKWAITRVEEYKAQIRASKANGGHYCPGKFDSALRWYWQSEIGHNQTSEHLRALVKPSGMYNVVKYDMSNNVVQMYALGLQDRSLAKYVGLVHNDETVEDLRLQLANAMNKNLDIDTFNRDNTKPLFMVWAYNAGKDRLLDGVFVEDRNIFTGELSKTMKVVGLRDIVASSGKTISDDLIWNTWVAILTKLAPSIIELKRVFSSIVKGNQFHEISWILPDGAIAQYASAETVGKELKWVSSNGHTHQHLHHRKQLKYGSRDAGLLPRMIHSIDAYAMRQIVIRANRMGITVVPNHDSFMFDEKHYETILNIVRTLFIEIMQDRVLYNLVTQFNQTKVKENGKYVDRETLLSEDIMSSFPMKLEA